MQRILNKIILILKKIKEADRAKSFKKDLLAFKKLQRDQRFEMTKADLFPCLYDKTSTTPFDAHYIYHPAWAARVLKHINPKKHVDISSILSFSTQISAFIPTDFYDYRPAEISLIGLNCKRADITNLPFPDDSIESISCMHTIEHIGLGRYGDPLAPDADIAALKELQRVVKKGGDLLLVTPVGKSRLQFNAHRIYSYNLIADQFNEFELLDFSMVDDKGKFHSPCDPELVKEQLYGCGCFWFRKNN